MQYIKHANTAIAMTNENKALFCPLEEQGIAMPKPSRQSSADQAFLHALWQAIDGDEQCLSALRIHGAGNLPSLFPVTDLACASIGAAALAVAQWVELHTDQMPTVHVDRRLASLWFQFSLRPQGWVLPPAWDPVAGDYLAADGWIRLHTNAVHHRTAALSVLNAAPEKESVAQAVARWRADELEAAIVAQGGCAAAMRSLSQWADHPQGRAVAGEPLAHWTFHEADTGANDTEDDREFDPLRPLAGIRVLDLTRVLAGPVATRFLAGWGANVLRIDPPEWDEPGIVPEVTPGKRCARLDLRKPQDSEYLRALLRQADIVVHGYRPDALARLGFDEESRRVNPALVDVCLNAYGWSGPWQGRRGFDSLMQMSCGIADAGMQAGQRDRPTPLPAQALDHATGYLMAAAAVHGLTRRFTTGAGCRVRTSLASMARLLTDAPRQAPDADALRPETPEDLAEELEMTHWGQARRLKPAARIEGLSYHWNRPAGPLGSDTATW
jgi:hypothetical protein